MCIEIQWVLRSNLAAWVDRMKKKQGERVNFVGGALILAASNVICRCLGFAFRIPLANLIGAEGMGYYSFAHQILNVVSAAGLSGLPPALVQKIASSPRERRIPILRAVRPLFTLTGLVGMLILLVFGGVISRMAGAGASRFAVMVLAPTALLSAWEAADRACFQGIGAMQIPSAAQTADATVKLISGTAAAVWLHQNGYPAEIVAAGAIFGVTLGTLVSAAIMAAGRRRIARGSGLRGDRAFGPQMRRELLKIAVPLTIGALLLSASGSVDAMVVMNRLRSLGLDESAATQHYGAYTGIALTVYSLPTAITSAICASVIPAVAQGKLRDVRGRAYLQTAYRLVSIVVWFASALFAVMPGELLALLFSRPGDVAIATPLLRMLAPAAVLSALCSLSASALHALGEMRVPIAAMAVGGLAKIVCSAVLVGLPETGISGAPVGTVVCFGIAAAVNGIALAKKSGFVPPFLAVVCKPAVCAAMAAVTVRVLPRVGNARMATVIMLASAVTVWGLMLFVTKTIRKEDIGLLKRSGS